MTKIKVNLKNAFGIEKLDYTFDFSKSRIFAIYARNGLMKTSFAKTFNKIQKNKLDEVKDLIFDIPAEVNILVDDNPIKADDVFVIHSYDEKYEANISSLLVDEETKKQLKDLLKLRDKFLKILEDFSGVKVKKTTGGIVSYELEKTIIDDFGFNERSILLNLEKIQPTISDVDFSDVNYSIIFDPTNLKKIKTNEFQQGIKNYILASDAIYTEFDYLGKGSLTYPKLIDLGKSLEKNGFFIKNNKLIFANKLDITTTESLDEQIKLISERLKKSPEMQAIEKQLQDSKGTLLKDIIELHPEIVEYLQLSKLSDLKKKLWISYINKNKGLYDDFKNMYVNFSEALKSISIDNTAWKQALDVFNQRFTVPFEMSISNLKSSIMGEEVPQVEFYFQNKTHNKKLRKSEIDELQTLSQGEKRALYLLNIIFDLENIKKSDKDCLIIVDDIADSFDYKNKYAIIEYLYELSKNEKINMIILSHNFDFYRTVSSRLNIERHNRLFSSSESDKILLKEEKYQNNPFEYWKNKLNQTKFVLALIPFIRNLIEYGNDKKKNKLHIDDFSYLTFLLHEKPETYNIRFEDLKSIYKEYLGKDNINNADEKEIVVDRLLKECDLITPNNAFLEDRIILSIGIRHLLEKYIFNQLKLHLSETVEWDNKNGTISEFLAEIDTLKNQTAYLIDVYKQIDSSKNNILDGVKIMTPENIHLNSFMYEPLIDMDINELLNLYQEVKNL